MDGASDSAELWLLTLQHSPVGMALVDLDGRLLMVNQALSEMLGYTAAELTRRGFQELTHPDDLDADLVLLHRTLAGEIDSYRMTKRYRRADGTFVWGDLSVALVRDDDDAPQHFISQVLDVTEQREAAERVAAANAELVSEHQALEAIFETVGVGLLLIGTDGRYERMNRRHAETMRLPYPDGHDGWAGQLGMVFQPDGTTPVTREEMPTYRAAQGEEFDDYVFWVGDDPMTRAAFSTSARQVRHPSGERMGAALAYQEITDVMRAMRARDEFVSSVSHELRTPLTSVLGHLELLIDDDTFAPRASSQLRVIQRNAIRLQALVSDLLHVAQAGEGSLHLQRAETDLVALVNDAVEGGRPFAKELGVAVDVATPQRVTALVDPRRIRQVLDNLLSNALKYTETGGRVTVELREDRAAVELRVTDTGIGIAPDEVDRVFGRFFRGGSALERHIPGTGLGLNIVATIVATHGGTVALESELGKGSTFRVTLPHTGL